MVTFKKTNPGFKRLMELQPIEYKGPIQDVLTTTQIKAIVNTVKYTMDKPNPGNIENAYIRTVGSIVAEMHTAKWTDGYMATPDIVTDITDPWEYSYDVITAPHYSSLKIEVKTVKGPTVAVSTISQPPYNSSNRYGINIRGYLSGVPDVFLFYYIQNNSTTSYIDVTLTPFMVCYSGCFDPKTKLVIKDPGFYNNWVINTNGKINTFGNALHFY